MAHMAAMTCCWAGGAGAEVNTLQTHNKYYKCLAYIR